MNYLDIDVNRLITGYQNVDDLVDFEQRNKRQRTTYIVFYPDEQYFNLDGLVNSDYHVHNASLTATLERIHPKKRKDWLQVMELLTERKKKLVKFYTIMKPWGLDLYRILSVTLSAVYDADGKIDRYTGFSNDISYEVYEKQTIQKERLRSEQLNTKYKMSFWSYDPTERLILSENKVHDALFHDYNEREFLDLHHPDYVQLEREKLELMRQQKTDVEDYVMSLFTPDGTYHYYHVSPEPLMDLEGHVVRYQLLCRDVTEEKKEEFRLKTFAAHTHQMAIRSGIRTFFYEPGSRHLHIEDNYVEGNLQKIELEDIFNQVSVEKRLQMYHFFAQCDARTMTRTEFRLNWNPIDGKGKRLYHILVMPVYDEKNQIVEYGLMRIDETEENEQQIMEQFMQRVGKIGAWTYNHDTNLVRMTEGSCDIIGYEYNADNQIDLNEYAQRTVVPEERKFFLDFIQKVIKEKNDSVITYHIHMADGSRKCVEQRFHIAQPSENVFYTSYGTILDISERERLEGERNEANELLKTVLNTLPISVFIKDADHNFRMLMANKNYADYFGKPLDKVIGHTLSEYGKSLQFDVLEENDRKAIAHTIDDPYIKIAKAMTATGETRYYQDTLFGIKLNGKNLLIGVCSDVTDIQTAMEKAENSDRLKSAFLANMSHEIRTPLNAIVGFSDLIASNASPEDNEQFVEIIHSNSDNLLRLIGDILDISKLEANAMKFCFTDFNVHDMMKEGYLSMQDRYADKPEIELQYTSVNEQVMVHQDRVRVMEVLNNFLTNAYKHTDTGSVKMWLDIKNGCFRIYVKDTGCGIPKEQQSDIFDRFQMVKGNMKEGTGLGLAISKQISERLGGSIGVESEVGAGSLFWAEFPIEGKETEL